MTAKRLEIGPGECRLGSDWVTVDTVDGPQVDFVCRWGAEALPFENDRFELVYASHVLEHVPWYQTVSALKEVHRVLRHGGTLEVHVPDLSVLIRAAQTQQCLDDHAEAGLNRELHWMHWVAERLFHLGPESQWHRACFNEAHLRWCLEQAGFRQCERCGQERGLNHGVVNLGMMARKSISDTWAAIPQEHKIHG